MLHPFGKDYVDEGFPGQAPTTSLLQNQTALTGRNVAKKVMECLLNWRLAK